MKENAFIPNNNKSVIYMLSKEFGRYNKRRNCILMGAISLCIITLTIVFGIALGKVQAEYIKSVRTAGMDASTCIEEATQNQYEKVCSLSYVKQAGRSVSVGEAIANEEYVCKIQVLDESAWEKIVKPAYTDIHGHYPKEKKEIMLSMKALEEIGIKNPKQGTKVNLSVNIGLFRTEKEEFVLCGWYTDYVDNQKNSITGYISEAKYEDWVYDIEKKSDILIRQSDSMDWQEIEERLYQDVLGKGSELKVISHNAFAYDAVNQLIGSYGMAGMGAMVILCGIFFLIYNVMWISMAGDVQQMGLLNMIGTTRKQICKVYYGQIIGVLIPGVLIGTFFSVFLLGVVIPKILGIQYLTIFGGAKVFRIFRPGILIASIVFATLITMGVSAGVIHHVVNDSCVESINYTSLKIGKKKRKSRKVKVKYTKRSSAKELLYMAWQNLIRYRGRFLLTVFSLFLGIEVFLGNVVITNGSDYIHVIEKRPDFLIAGKFSDWGQREGYGDEYKSRDAGEDPMKTEGGNFCLLYGNDYDEFSPISLEAKESLLNLDGVDKKSSYIMQGAYMITTISRNGISPLIDNFDEKAEIREGSGYDYDYSMIEGFDADVIQIISDEEIAELQQYVKENNLTVDLESLKNGTGVVILHDHQLSPKQEKMAEKSIGEPVFFTTLLSKEDWSFWNQLNQKERNSMDDTEMSERKQSERFELSGYLDNRLEGFPHIRQTWHGAEGTIYYLISEKGFEKIPTKKKTLYMELNVDEEKEPEIKAEIQDILFRENRKREKMTGVEREGETGEAGIFCISKSDLLSEARNYMQGNRLILGSISVVLFFVGLMNYFNVMITGILSRRKELGIMEKVGMTKEQKRKLLVVEGLYYCLAVAIMIPTIGYGILRLIGIYMEKKLSYFVFCYPVELTIVLIVCLAVICLMVSEVLYRKENKIQTNES